MTGDGTVEDEGLKRSDVGDRVQKIIGKIRTDSEKKVKHILAKGKERTEAFIREKEVELERELRTLRIEKEREIKTMRGKILSEAKLSARKVELEAREECIRKAFELAKEELMNLPDERYRRYLRYHLSIGKELFGNDFIVLTDERDRTTVSSVCSTVSPGIKVATSTDEWKRATKGTKTRGIVLMSQDRTRIVDFTFHSALERMKGDLRREVAERLFKEKI